MHDLIYRFSFLLHSVDPEQKEELISYIEKLLADKTTVSYFFILRCVTIQYNRTKFEVICWLMGNFP